MTKALVFILIIAYMFIGLFINLIWLAIEYKKENNMDVNVYWDYVTDEFGGILVLTVLFWPLFFSIAGIIFAMSHVCKSMLRILIKLFGGENS